MGHCSLFVLSSLAFPFLFILYSLSIFSSSSFPLLSYTVSLLYLPLSSLSSSSSSSFFPFLGLFHFIVYFSLRIDFFPILFDVRKGQFIFFLLSLSGCQSIRHSLFTHIFFSPNCSVSVWVCDSLYVCMYSRFSSFLSLPFFFLLFLSFLFLFSFFSFFPFFLPFVVSVFKSVFK